MSKYQFNQSTEIWKAISGCPGYEVSDHGRVRSYRVYDGKTRPGKIISHSHILKGSIHKAGYTKFTLLVNGKPKCRNVHRLILEAFIGPCPIGYQACHNDGNPSNNQLSNLRWDTVSNNKLDCNKHGTMPIGENHHNARLSVIKVISIRLLSLHGITAKQLAYIYHIDITTVYQIINRKTWRYI